MTDPLLLTEIDGKVVPLTECSWVLWEKCGCPIGTLAGRVATTPDAAMAEFYPRKTERVRRLRNGYRMELMTHERWKTEVSVMMRRGCPEHRRRTATAVTLP